MKKTIVTFAFIAAFALSAQAGTVSFITSSTGLAGTIGFPGSFTSSTYTTGGNSVNPGDGFFLGGQFYLGSSAVVTLAAPTSALGFSWVTEDSVSGFITGIVLSNGDSFTTQESLPEGSGFAGITDTSSFTSATFTFSDDSTLINSFSYSTAPAAPEPATFTLLAPLLLAGFVGLRRQRISR